MAAEDESKSLAKSAPQLLYLVNHSPYVYGLPGTVDGDISNRTQLFGDWNGIRECWANRGIYFDVYSTTNFQGIFSGGVKKAGIFSQSTDFTLNIDTTQLGLWPGAIIHTNIQSRYGSSVAHENLAGTLIPANGAWLFPVVEKDNIIAVTEYYILQALTPSFMLVGGKCDALYLADQNIFASNYRYQFENTAFQANAVLGQYFHPIAWIGGCIWQPLDNLRIITAITDPYSEALNFATKAFHNIGILQEFDATYMAGSLPGAFTAGWAWSNEPRPNLSDPFSIDIFGTGNFSANSTVNSAACVYTNFAQYLYVSDDPASVAAKAKLSLPPRGLGIFGRLSVGPESCNIISLFGSFGISGMGLFDCRPLDQFGAGWYIAHISKQFKRTIRILVADLNKVGATLNPDIKDEQGLEIYYNYVITPAVQLTVDFQQIWNPFKADFTFKDHTSILGVRLQTSF